MSKLIRVPEHGWEGVCKKIEFRDEDVIRATFEYASLIGTDFTEAMRRALRIALPLIIQSERESQARFAACFSSYSSPSPPQQQQVHQSHAPEADLIIPPPRVYSSPVSPQEFLTEPQPSKSVKSGGHLI
jgi:hypothetical protein